MVFIVPNLEVYICIVVQVWLWIASRCDCPIHVTDLTHMFRLNILSKCFLQCRVCIHFLE